MGRKRSYMLAFEGIVKSLQRRYKRDRLGSAARADRGVHVLPGLPVMPRRAAQARGTRRHRRREEHPPVHADVGRSGARVPRGARADRGRGADRRADHQGDPRAPELPGQRRRRLPDARPRGAHAVGRRGAAAAARDADRLAARRRPLHPRRAVDRAPPARQRPPDRHARTAARPRQHRARRRARRADDALRRLARGHGAGRGRARRLRRRRGAGQGRGAEQEVDHRASSSPRTREIAVPERRPADNGVFRVLGARMHNLKGIDVEFPVGQLRRP